MPKENEIRCVNPKCRKILAKGDLVAGDISIKCKCGTTTTIAAELPKREEPEKFIHNRPYQNRMGLEQK